MLLVSAITLHNIPEGLAVGVAFGAAAELIPESQRGGNGDLATLALLVGFATMMTLDMALG